MNFLTCIFRLGFELLGKLHLESMVVCETFSLFGEITYHLIFGTNFLALISVLQSKLYDVTWILYCDCKSFCIHGCCSKYAFISTNC